VSDNPEQRSRLFKIAEEIAHQHTNRGWFESPRDALAREIRLRSDIYHALRDAKERKE